MKNLLLFFFVLPIFINAQKSNPDTLNYVEINGIMQNLKIDSFQIAYFPSNLTGSIYKAPFNDKRKEEAKKLSSEIDFLNISLFDVISEKNNGLLIDDFGSMVDNFSSNFPSFNIRGYRKAYNYFKSNYEEKKMQEKLEEQKMKQDKEAFFKRIDSLKIVNDQNNERERRRQDSIDYARKLIQDSIAFRERKINDIKYLNECIKKFGKVTGTRIANSKIKLGDTMEMVNYAWGMADDINTTYSTKGTLETWWFIRYRSLLSFKKGILISITE